MNNFQTILIAVFIAFFVFAVMIFSGFLPIGNSNTSNAPQGRVAIWGTFPSGGDLGKTIDTLNGGGSNALSVSYIQKPQANYEQSLIEAFANGTGPDLFFMSPDMILKNQNFISTIPYATYPENTFRSNFIDGADIYLSKAGIIGLPVVVDPLVLYYNKNILSNNGIAKPPTYWSELSSLNSTLTNSKNDGTILTSMIALGAFDNINNAKDILAMLLLQSGDSIVSRQSNDVPFSVFNQSFNQSTSPAQAVMDFYTSFSNPSLQSYSWNRAMPQSRDAFTAGKLAFYIGRASEIHDIESVNPNLSFDVTQILQTQGTNILRTEGPIYALSINKKSTNAVGALGVAQILSLGDIAKSFATALSLPPASRTLLIDKPTGAGQQYLFTFFNSAIFTQSWLDPDSTATDSIFKELLDNTLSNKLSGSSAISKAETELEQLLSTHP